MKSKLFSLMIALGALFSTRSAEAALISVVDHKKCTPVTSVLSADANRVATKDDRMLLQKPPVKDNPKQSQQKKRNNRLALSMMLSFIALIVVLTLTEETN